MHIVDRVLDGGPWLIRANLTPLRGLPQPLAFGVVRLDRTNRDLDLRVGLALLLPGFPNP